MDQLMTQMKCIVKVNESILKRVNLKDCYANIDNFEFIDNMIN